MARFKATLLTLLAVALTATALASCGGEEEADLLPGETATEIKANLTLVEDLAAQGDCVGAGNAAAAVSEEVEALTGVDPKLQEALAEGAAKLNEVVVECDEAPEEDETAPEVDPEAEAEEADQEAEEKDREREEKAAEKEEQKAQKDQEKAEKEAEAETPSNEPPGQEKKEEETEVPPTEPSEGGTPSGGVSPSTPAGSE